jgi:hypothetical protein
MKLAKVIGFQGGTPFSRKFSYAVWKTENSRAVLWHTEEANFMLERR